MIRKLSRHHVRAARQPPRTAVNRVRQRHQPPGAARGGAARGAHARADTGEQVDSATVKYPTVPSIAKRKTDPRRDPRRGASKRRHTHHTCRTPLQTAAAAAAVGTRNHAAGDNDSSNTHEIHQCSVSGRTKRVMLQDYLHSQNTRKHNQRQKNTAQEAAHARHRSERANNRYTPPQKKTRHVWKALLASNSSIMFH